MTYAAKAESLVQNFAARWRSIRKIFFNPNQATRRNNAKYNSKINYNTHLKSEKRRERNQSSKTIIILIFISKQNKHGQAAQFAGKKNKGSLKANFLSYHHYLMEALDCNINKTKEEEETHRKPHRKKGNNKQNSPHSKRSLHNNPPRKFRNVVPEMPTQNMATQPQSIAPLISPHWSHSCNVNNTVFNTNTEPKLYNKLYIGKYLRI
jgi:hypothetical protein